MTMFALLQKCSALNVATSRSMWVASQPLLRSGVSSTGLRLSSRVRCSVAADTPAPPAGAATLRRKKVAKLLDEGENAIGSTVLLKGWVRTVRSQKAFSFVEVNDGSSLKGMQVVAAGDMQSYETVMEELSTGAAVSVIGEVVASKGKGQVLEVKASSVELVGACPADEYPLQKKKHSLEFLRSIAHLRPRSNLFGAVSRVRSELAQATHAFFASEGFKYVQTPILTASDCEGAGEMFRVTTLSGAEAAAAAGEADAGTAPAVPADELQQLEAQAAAQGARVSLSCVLAACSLRAHACTHARACVAAHGGV